MHTLSFTDLFSFKPATAIITDLRRGYYEENVNTIIAPIFNSGGDNRFF